jgi:hypothetical protein
MLRRTGLDQSCCQNTQHLADIEYASSTTDLVGAIERAIDLVNGGEIRHSKDFSGAKQKRRSGRFAYLKQSNQKPIRHHLAIALNTKLQEREDSPPKIHPWHEPMHRHSGKYPSKGYLTNNRPDDVHGLELNQLITVETEVS